MSKALVLIFALFAISQAASFRVADSFLTASNNGQIALNYLPGAGFVAPADLAPNSANPSKNFIISLYTSDVLLAQSCLKMDQYKCAGFMFCKKTAEQFQTEYAYFTAQGVAMSTKTILDYSNWILNGDFKTKYATACATSPANQGLFGNAQGIIGLGFEGAARNNFAASVSGFSLFNNNGMKLVFNPNLNFKQQLIAKVQTNQAWRIPTIAQFSIGQQLNKGLSGISAILDINSDTTGLPISLFNDALLAFKVLGVDCSQGGSINPRCTYNGDAMYLPTITLWTNPQTKIEISPLMYVANNKPATAGQIGSFNLNFRAITPAQDGLNYVTPTYQNSIILGNNVLSNYYTYFNMVDSTVNFIKVQA